MAATDKVLSIHYLRVIAALMVVCMHTFSYGLVSGYGQNPVYWMKHGVSIFFVISGFVIVTSTEKAPRDGAKFFQRRFLRIAPIYWIATLLLVASGISDRGDGARLLPSLLLMPTQVEGAARLVSPTLEVGWTLCIEMAFYLLFALAMALPRRTAVVGTASGLIVVGLLAPLLAGNPWADFYLTSLVLEFGAGMALAWSGLKAPWWLCPVGFVMMATAGAVSENHFLTASIPAIAIVAGARGMDQWLRPIRLLVLLGDASYAIYLFHLHALMLLVVPLVGRPAPAVVILPVGFAVAIVLGVAAHRRIEVPLAAIIAARLKRRARVSQVVPAPSPA